MHSAIPDEHKLDSHAALMAHLTAQGRFRPAILEAMQRFDRADFLEDGTFSPFIYADSAVPIAVGQTISQPSIVALMSDALELSPQHRVLEIGTGSGYQAAILSCLARRVFSVERHFPLYQKASACLQKLGCHNVVTRFGDGFNGWPEQAPFNRVILTAAAPAIPDYLFDQMADDGLMVAPIGEAHQNQELWRFWRHGDHWHQEYLADVRFVPMQEGRVHA